MHMSQATAKFGENDVIRKASEGSSQDLGGFQAGYTGFSCPLEAFDESLAEMIAGEYARSVLDIFVDQFASLFSQTSGLKALFSCLLDADLPFNLAWSSDLGNLYQATLRRDEERAMNYAAAFALMAGAQGFGGEWELTLSRPTKFFWDDWLLPECDKLSVASDRESACINLSLGIKQTQISFARSANGWTCQTPGRAVRLPAFGSGTRQLVLFPRSAALDNGFFRDDEDAAGALESFSPTLIETLTCALDLLEHEVPHYFDWVVRIIRRVTVLHSHQDHLYSGSQKHQHGAIHISDSPRVLSVGEMLVHEASHQYLELLTKLGPAVHPNHAKLYYSPVKKCDRPLDRILLAYHAFANVTLFYRVVLERDLADDYFKDLHNLSEELRQLEQPLIGSDAITPIGRALVQPLIDRGVCR
jgi:hypothetical protein